jgi:vacuolar-type H+-ATPase subunit D/Vma8
MEVENLKWQISYEKKLHEEMSQLLENKVSHLMAEVRQLNKHIDEQNEKISNQE